MPSVRSPGPHPVTMAEVDRGDRHEDRLLLHADSGGDLYMRPIYCHPRCRSPPMDERLLQALLDARRVELQLLEDLTPAQMTGERQHFIEPPIWEMGHVGWFQEWWISRHLDGSPSLLPGSDGIYDSFHVSYTRRWE